MIQTQKFVQDLKDDMQYEKRYKYQVPFSSFPSRTISFGYTNIVTRKSQIH